MEELFKRHNYLKSYEIIKKCNDIDLVDDHNCAS